MEAPRSVQPSESLRRASAFHPPSHLANRLPLRSVLPVGQFQSGQVLPLAQSQLE